MSCFQVPHRWRAWEVEKYSRPRLKSRSDWYLALNVGGHAAFKKSLNVTHWHKNSGEDLRNSSWDGWDGSSATPEGWLVSRHCILTPSINTIGQQKLASRRMKTKLRKRLREHSDKSVAHADRELKELRILIRHVIIPGFLALSRKKKMDGTQKGPNYVFQIIVYGYGNGSK